MDGGDFHLSNIDRRVVEMAFDNAQFERDMKTTVKSLFNFEKQLNSIESSDKTFSGLTKGLETLKNNVKSFSLDSV